MWPLVSLRRSPQNVHLPAGFDMARKPDDDAYSDEEAARRRDAVLKTMLNTPPQPRSVKAKGGKPEGKPPKVVKDKR